MNILLTNDDGIHAKGLKILREKLAEQYAVYTIAPDSERSGCSNAIQIRQSIKVSQMDEHTYAVDGYTADCVNIGLNGGLIPPVDLVVSGINHGPNLGDDINFSGTVAGARTAYIFGVSGIALSIDSYAESDYFCDAAHFLLQQLNDFPLYKKLHPLFLNINYPDRPRGSVKGIKYTQLGKRFYRDAYRIINKNNNTFNLELDGTIENEEKTGSDVTEIRNGYVVITPLTIDCTDYNFIDRLHKREITENIWKN